MKKENSRFKMLADEEADNMYDKCLGFLSEKGVIVQHPKTLRILDKAGAHVDFKNEQVRFPREMIEAALGSVPRGFKLAGRNEISDLTIPNPDGLFYVCTCTGNQLYIDPESLTHRYSTLADVEEFGRFVQALDQIDIAAYPFATDMPPETTDIHSLRALFQNTSKHIEIQPFSFKSISYLFEMALAVSGSAEALRNRPIITLIICAVSPFTFKPMDVEGIVECCRHGTPIMACSLPSAGGTSPITTAGTVLQASTEILAMLVMSQVIKPGTPFIACPLIFTLDMATGKALQSSVEAMLGATMASEFIKGVFHVPTAPSVFEADSHIFDEQAAIESSLAAKQAASGRMSDILLGAGGLDGLLGFSPVKLIVDNTLAIMLKRIVSGIKIDDETLAWEDLLDITPGAGFIERPHTLRHCRDALPPELLTLQSLEIWRSGGSKGLAARALEQYRDLKKELEPIPLPAEVNREMDLILKRADKHLTK